MNLDSHIGVDRGENFALDATIGIEAEETVALLGPNGAGKSTVVMAIAGILPIDRGHIRLGDHVLDRPDASVFVPPAQRSVGVVFQDHVLFPHLSAVDNVAFGLESAGATRREARRVAGEWLERVHIGAERNSKPGQLSGGQSQRVALARALAVQPDLLLLDEPLAALDVATRSDLRRLLAQHLAGFGGPRMLITHDPAEAFLLGDRVVVLENGRVTQMGTPDEIRRHPVTQYAADVAGLNLLTGTISGGVVDVGVDPPIHIADSGVSGNVLVTIHPRSISLHREMPHGSPRNVWPTTVAVVEPLGDRVRIQLGAPHELTVELTEAAVRDLGVEPGVPTWVAIKATEVSVQPA